MVMNLYDECKCLESDLLVHLKKAMQLYKKEELKDVKIDTVKIESEIQSAVNQIKTLSSDPLFVRSMEEKLREEAKTKLPAIVQEIQDIEHYLNTCECPDETDIDWRKEIFTPFGTRVVSRPRSSAATTTTGSTPKYTSRSRAMEGQMEACGVTEGRTKELLDQLSQFEHKIYDTISNNKTVESNIIQMYPNENHRTGTNLLHNAPSLGILTQDEQKELYSLADEISSACPDRKILADLNKSIYHIRVKKGWARQKDPFAGKR